MKKVNVRPYGPNAKPVGMVEPLKDVQPSNWLAGREYDERGAAANHSGSGPNGYLGPYTVHDEEK